MYNFIRRNKIPMEVSDLRLEEEHSHQDVELIYVLGGKMNLSICKKMIELSEDDIIVINSNEKHGFTASNDIFYAKITISYNLIKQVYNGVSSIFLCDSSKEDRKEYKNLRNILRRMLMNQLVANENEKVERKISYEYLAEYFSLLEELTVHFLLTTSSSEKISQDQKSAQRVTQINDYMLENYSQPISLQSLAEYLHLSESYLSRYFKTIFHMNFTDYLKEIRLSHALEDLIYTDQNITKIAYNNGFCSVSFFNRVFKAEYGKTPSSFRKSNAGKKGEINKIQDTKTRTKLEETLCKNKDNIEKHQFRCSVKNNTPLKPIWNQILNIGSAVDLLKNDIQEHVILLKESLDFKYARFWSLFSKEMMIDIQSKDGQYNFSKVDKVIDFILSVGLKPFIDLEEKTKRVNVNLNSTLTYEENVIELESIKQWERIMEALFRHFVRRYGMEEVAEWKVEVWYGGYILEEKDIRESYFSVFRSTKNIAKKYVPGIEVGGCGMFPEYQSTEKIREKNFWREWVQYGTLPDFISLMNYSYDMELVGGARFGKKNGDEQFLLHSISKLKKVIQDAGMKEIPIYITEWNLTISDRNCMNDTCFQGAYVVKNIIDVYGEVDMLGYFSGSDRTSEYYDSIQLLHGGQGLLTKDGIFKPTAFAMEFLNHMEKYFIDKNSNYLVSTDRRDRYTILCHNMKKLSYYYYLTEEGMIEKDNIWKCFEDRNELEMEICMEDVENGQYLMRIQRINEMSGSVLDIWKEMNYQPELSREDVKYFRRVCEPRLMIKKCTADEHKVTLHITMAPNEIALIRLEKE